PAHAFSFSLVRPDALSWVSFGGPRLTFTLQPPQTGNAPPPPDPNWTKVTALQKFLTGGNYRVAPPGTTIGAERVYNDQPTTWPVTSMTPWQNARPVALPFGSAPSGVQSLRLWGVPDSLINLDDADRLAPPRALPVRGNYDEGSGETIETPLAWYGWATRVNLTVKQLPPDAGAATTAFTYQLVGSGEADILLLERLLAKLDGHSNSIASMTLLYAASAASGQPAGLQSDDTVTTVLGPGAAGPTVTLGILQANLSTVTNPPTLVAAARAAVTSVAGCINQPYDFIRLLWECSITRSGGYYLYYFDRAAAGGLPGGIFNDKGEASLTLLVMRSAATQQNLIDGFVNCLVTGESFDAKSTVYAASAPIAATVAAGATDSLAKIAYRAYMDPVALAEANPGAVLVTGGRLTVARGLYEVGPQAPGGDPNAIASYFGTTLALLKTANPQISDWNTALVLYTALRLPTITYTVGSIAGLTTLSSLARYFGTTISEVAADNAGTPGLIAASPQLTVPGGPMSRSATVPAGCIALAATRAEPATPPDPTNPNFARLFIESQIVLLGYRLTGNAWFKDTNPGLPISHADTPAGDVKADRTRTPRLRAANAPPWRYDRAIPVARNVRDVAKRVASLPDPAKSPYAGVGGLAQIDLGWVDVFGNTVKSELGDNAGVAPLNRPPLPVGYVDALVALSQWPGANADYAVLVPNGGGPTVRLTLSFDPTGYSPSTPEFTLDDKPAWQVRAERALLIYDQLYYQLSQLIGPSGHQVPAVALTVATTLLPGTDLAVDRDKVTAWLFGANGVYAFLQARSQGDQNWPAPADLVADVAFALSAINAAQVYELTTTFTLARPAALVDPAFADTAGFVTATTPVGPQLVKGSDGTYQLAAFASAVEQCLLQAGVFTYKLAGGVDRA
ncbi:MAG TPA: hypothetical protein VH165_26825, partial [Kofleriaceae bacterium]|nr:hypothetical protein [Kofleriaceae bacterium]